MSNGEILKEIDEMVESNELDDAPYKRLTLRLMGELYRFNDKAEAERHELGKRVGGVESAVEKIDGRFDDLDASLEKDPSLIWLFRNDMVRFFKVITPVLAILLVLIAIADAVGIFELITRILSIIN